MIDAARLLADLQPIQRKLEADLRQQVADETELSTRLQADYQQARTAKRTAATFDAWLEGELTQAAVAWLLGCVFLRFSEDNALLPQPLLAGPGKANTAARDAMRAYFSEHPLNNARDWLLYGFAELAKAPAVAGLFSPQQNPLYRVPISAYAADDLVKFWQAEDADTGELLRNFTDPQRQTRFLGDLYQDLSESARKRFALLQTPHFVESFILDRTLTPAIDTFGVDAVRMIDPTCGSGHFVLGAFERIVALHADSGVEARERVKRALAAVHGVDLNPFAVAIARFRLLVAALQAAGVRTLKEAPGWQFNLTTGDSLLHGRRFGELDLGADLLDEHYSHCYHAEDQNEINRILGQQYHAVVGNPPYITASDKALNTLYRARYQSCHMKYSLGVPFTERFIQLAVAGDKQPAGFVGLITTNSFMKREFGKKLVEEYLPKQDVTHVIDTSGAYIPGHGTPTVILFARHRKPVLGTIRTALGVRGEPSTPVEPAKGKVWSSIVELLERPGSETEFISIADLDRDFLAEHPWSLTGGVAPTVLNVITTEKVLLGDIVEHVGIGAVTGCDPVIMSPPNHYIASADPSVFRSMIVGDQVRDWSAQSHAAHWPYLPDLSIATAVEIPSVIRFFWPYKSTLNKRKRFGTPMVDRGYEWYEYQELYTEKLKTPLSITFAEVATHNHFVLDRGGKVFNRTAPVIKLPSNADEATHMGLLGLLNSSTACFWLKQSCFNKGDSTDQHGARVTGDPAFDTFQFAGTRLAEFPLTASRPIQLVTKLEAIARQRTDVHPAAISSKFPLDRATLNSYRIQFESFLGQLVASQEELDWWCYRAYGLIDEDMCCIGEPVHIQRGERAFEILLGRQIAAEDIGASWFKRHGIAPITEIPAHWPADYAALVQRRIDLIESNPWIGLLEKPEYKRRWNQPGWDELEKAALKSWLLDRLEGPGYWGEHSLQSLDSLIHRAEADADFMAVAQLYAGQQGFAVAPLLQKLLDDETVPAVKVLRYKDSGLRKRADWERTWELQRQEDAVDAEIAASLSRETGESDKDYADRLQAAQAAAKRKQIGDIPAPPKYKAADFIKPTIKRLRGDLDVPKERFFSLPNADTPGQSFYGWAGWSPVQRVQAVAGTYTELETIRGWPANQLVPLLVAVAEELPWVMQWHNDIDADLGLRLGDYFSEWLGSELQKHGLSRQNLVDWRP